VLALSPADRQQIIMAFSDAINPHLHLNNPAVVVVNQPTVRKPLWNLLKAYLPEVVVLSYQDLTPELSPQAVKVVMMEG
jgi:flagellar biosynthesis component FlhA